MRYTYFMHEAIHASIGPMRALSEATKTYLSSTSNPMSGLSWSKNTIAACDMFERVTRRYAKPTFDLDRTVVNDEVVSVHEKIVWKKPFCQLIHFERSISRAHTNDPKLLIVAPMSGHYATLLRGTVEAFLPHHEVYITDWIDARMVPMTEGKFDLNDYVDYIKDMLHHLGEGVHVMGVCQPSVPVIAAVARMDAENDSCTPRSMTLMGGPIDTRKSPTAVNVLAEKRGIRWFENNCIVVVPFNYPGFMRRVYPGFMQLSGFMAMNMDRHMTAHKEYFDHLVTNDGDSAEKHREFYDEYLAVMDLTAEFYLQTVDTVFVKHALPKGEMLHHGEPVDLTKIKRTALMTVEGEKDDISGIGQTKAAHDLCTNIPADMRVHYEQKDVGHYGVFNGSRFRSEIAPRIAAFIEKEEKRAGAGRSNVTAITAGKGKRTSR
ncbi:MAG: polyhydroxyalkanoate depolymerase [Beijerinckiaceae bacterium]